jgi:Flp pilus assembly protein TadD
MDCPEPRGSDVGRAVALAQNDVARAPQEWGCWNTLAVALYRAGEWQAAREALTRSVDLGAGDNSWNWFFLAMAHWRLGEPDVARDRYDRACSEMKNSRVARNRLLRLRGDVAALLGVSPPP